MSDNTEIQEETQEWEGGYGLFTENMSFSNQTHLLTAAWIEAKAEMGNVCEYDSKNPHFKNRFASLEATLTKINPIFSKHGLALSQWPSGNQLINRLEHKSGQWIMSAYDISAVKKDPQQMGSAITYARRYCVQAIAGICGGEDDDAEMAMDHGNGGGSVSIGGPRQKPEDIFQEFLESVSDDSFVEELNNQWDELMRRTNKLADRKKLASLLNNKKNSLLNPSSGDDL